MEQAIIYIGTNTRDGSKGIYKSTLNLASGHLSEPTLAASLSSPAFLTTDSLNRYLYCTGNGDPISDIPANVVSAFSIDQRNGSLSYLNGQQIAETNFCHISTDQQGTVLLGADYHYSKVAAFPLTNDGQIETVTSYLHHSGYTNNRPDRQDVPHLHSINMDRANQFVFVCDFSADEVVVYRYQAETKTITHHSAVSTASGAGPRHLTTHPNGEWVYVINELNGTITLYDFDVASGILAEKQTIATLPDDFTGTNTTAEIAISPNLRFLYGSNRGHDSIAHYQIDPQDGHLTFVARTSTTGEHPRNFTLDPTGQFMLVSNRDTNNVVVFRLDQETGTPVPTGYEINISMPMCIKIIAQSA
ncbi:MAG: lactonase family protein [Chloroflexota bacterium]